MHTNSDKIVELHDLASCMLERDGSCRDVNFQAPSWNGVRDLLISIVEEFQEVEYLNADYLPIHGSEKESHNELSSCGGYVLLKKGTSLVTQLRVFVFAEGNGQPFVELTFFPQDVLSSPSLRSDTLSWMSQKMHLLGASKLFVRFEGASWEWGDVSEQSGVFLILE